MRKSGRLPGDLQNKIRQVFKRNGGVMVWSEEIGDKSLIREVRSSLQSGSLASSVLLVANDHHFCPLVKEVQSSGRLVVVSGHQVSRRLVKVADKVIPFPMLLPEKVEIPKPNGGIGFNPIPI